MNVENLVKNINFIIYNITHYDPEWTICYDYNIM